MEGLNSIARARGLSFLVQGLGPVFHTAFTDASVVEDYRSYCQADAGRLSGFLGGLLHRGVRITGRGTWFLSTSHTRGDIKQTLCAADEVLRELA